MLRFAKWYFDYGWKIIPSREKKALVSGWGKGGSLVIDKEQVERWWGNEFKDANISLLTGGTSNVLVLDTDTKDAEQTICDLLPPAFSVPTAKTPRGGRHRFFRYESGFSSRRYMDGLDVKTDGGVIVLPKSQNSNGQYEWIEGMKPKSGVPLPSLPANLAKYLQDLYTVHQRLPIDRFSDLRFKKGSRDQDLFHAAWCLSKGGMSDYNVSKVLGMLGELCEPPFPEKELGAKVNSAVQRLQEVERNISQEVRMYALATVGFFSSTEVYQNLILTTRKEKKLTSKVLGEMVEQGLLERNTKRNGIFRKVETVCERIDFLSASGEEIPFNWPLGEEKLFKLMPKNIILYAGTPDSSKSAMMFNIIALNMHRHEMHYFSSEMGDTELKGRLSNYEGLALEDWNFTAWDRAEGFHDIIRPDAINIIDFLEIHQDFFAIGGYIKQIFDKLKDGVAIIAIQKNPKVQTPLGGYRAMEKARLIVNLESDYPGNVAEITKAKNWRTERNPKGKKKHFRLYDGINISETSGWEY